MQLFKAVTRTCRLYAAPVLRSLPSPGLLTARPSAELSRSLSLTSSRLTTTRPPFTDIPAVFQRIQSLSNEEIVEKVNAIYVFDVENEGKWYIDLSQGTGAMGGGELPEGLKPDVTVVINKDNLLKMFNRELKPATAFMSGKLKMSGDISKALALESVMKASRED